MRKAITRTTQFAWKRWRASKKAASMGNAAEPIFPSVRSIEDWARFGGGLAPPHTEDQRASSDTVTGHGGP